jgi:hypothetical protein
MSAEKKHTPEPWSIGDSNIPVSGIAVCGGNGFHSTIARLVAGEDWYKTHGEAAANAARIVACVNYCAGIPTAALTGPHTLAETLDNAVRRCEELTRQRDRLLAALDSIGGLSLALRSGGPDPMDLQELSDALSEAIDLAHNAIAGCQP